MERDFGQVHVVVGQEGNGLNLKEGRFRLSIRGKFFTVSDEALKHCPAKLWRPHP